MEIDHHVPDSDRIIRLEKVRTILREVAFAGLVEEKSTMMTKLEEAMFWANAGIAREGK